MRDWPFIGRDHLAAVVAGSLTGHKAVLLEGVAGIGKTTVADHVARGLDGSVAKVRANHTFSAYDGIGLLRSETLEVSSFDPAGFVHAVVQRWAQDSPEFVWVDDVGQLDEASAVVLFHVAMNGSSRLLLTTRVGSPPSELVKQLETTGELVRFEVQPLSVEDCSALLNSVLGGPTASGLASQVCSRAQGNPLVIRELVRAALADRSLSSVSGVWQWSESSTVLRTAAELTAQRLGSLPAPSRRLVDLLVLAGELPTSVLAVGYSRQLQDLVDADMVIIENESAHLAHPLFIEAARLNLHGDLRVDRISELISLVGPIMAGPAQQLRMLRWRREAKQKIEPSELVRGLHLAMAVFDTATAIDLGNAAVEAGRTEAALPLAMALLYDGQLEEASLASKLAVEQASDEATRAFASVSGSLARGYQYGFGSSITDAHTELLSSMTDPALSAFVRSELGSALAFSGQLLEAVEVSSEGATSGQWWERVPFVPGWAGAMTALGRTDEVLQTLGQLVEEAGHSGGRSVAWLHAFRSSAALLHGDLSLAQTAIESFDECAYMAMVPGVAAVLHSETRGIAALWKGEIDAARALLTEAVARSDVPESEFRRVVPTSFLAIACALDDDAQAAARYAAEAEESASKFALGAGWVALAQSWAQACAGDKTGASRTAERGAQWAIERNQFHAALWCAFDAWRFVPSSRTAKLVSTAASHADGRWSAAFTATAKGWLGNDLSAWDAAAEWFTSIGAAAHLDLLKQRRAELLGSANGDLVVGSLTRRESEVALLAASGARNREIADRLQISVRTAETHLHRAMGKLGCAAREDLAMYQAELAARI